MASLIKSCSLHPLALVALPKLGYKDAMPGLGSGGMKSGSHSTGSIFHHVASRDWGGFAPGVTVLHRTARFSASLFTIITLFIMSTKQIIESSLLHHEF